jgi:hypothetical protein
MIRTLLMLVLLLAATGCASYSYSHATYAADGKTPTAVYRVDIWRNAIDARAASARLTLADGTRLTISNAEETPDPGIVQAFVTLGDSLIGFGAIVIKFFGL